MVTLKSSGFGLCVMKGENNKRGIKEKERNKRIKQNYGEMMKGSDNEERKVYCRKEGLMKKGKDIKERQG